MTAKSSKGDAFLPYGENPAGMNIYSNSDDVSVILMRANRSKFASGDPQGGSAEEIGEASKGFDAYGATYEVDMENRSVTHHIEIGLFPN